MHEMSIAQNILEIVKDYATKENAKEIKEIELEIGTLAGIEFESLEFALSVSLKTPLTENTDIQINKVQAKSICLDCNFEFETLNLFEHCHKCKSYNTKLIQGKELQVKSLLID
jgi:hydrogenase nickel incorporation protein HypA/HybF